MGSSTARLSLLDVTATKPGFIPEGLCILGGRPKMQKTPLEFHAGGIRLKGKLFPFGPFRCLSLDPLFGGLPQAPFFNRIALCSLDH